MDTFLNGLKTFINDYGVEILTTIITAVASYLAVVIKNLATKYLNDKTKKDIAKIVVEGIEQCYKALDGPAKLEKALEAASTMLAEKGIKVTEVELRMLLESALGEFNKVFEKETGEKAESEDWTSAVLPEDAEISDYTDGTDLEAGG